MSNRTGIYVRVSTDDQRDNGYSIDSQLRMLKEYCEKNDLDVVDVYNDAGHSGKDLMRPDMQRLLEDIKAHKLDRVIAIKVDRLTRNGYDGFWLLNYCEQHDVKIELILEPYDVGTANGEMIFGMNLVFGQRERKEIGARTKRAMEQMALTKIHPGKAPFGYVRDNETGRLSIEPIEAQSIKEVFELYAKGNSIRDVAAQMRDNHRYLKSGKWESARVYNILNNPIYNGTFAFGLYKRKPEDILYVDDYCDPIIDKDTWNKTRATLEKNKHSNFGEHIHLFTSLVKCPDCKGIMSSTLSYKHSGTPRRKEYYHVTCKNNSCSSKGIHYSSDKIEEKLKRVLNELTRYMYDNSNEILTSSSKKPDELKEIDKAIDKLQLNQKKLIDLYLGSTVNVEMINQKNDSIKKEILGLQKKKESMFPNDDNKEFTVELLRKLDCIEDNNALLFPNNFSFSYLWDSLNRKSKKEMLNRFISSLEITKDKKHNIEITNIKFTDELISKSNNEFLEYLNFILQDNNKGIHYKESVTDDDIKALSKNHLIISTDEIDKHMDMIEKQFWRKGIISCPHVKDGTIIDTLLLIPKTT